MWWNIHHRCGVLGRFRRQRLQGSVVQVIEALRERVRILNQDHLPKAVEGDAWAQVMPVDDRDLRNARIPRGRPILDFLLLQTNDVNCDTLRTLDVVRKQKQAKVHLPPRSA